jgi:pimeloyl-ACP methyl ester carboxylesterase
MAARKSLIQNRLAAVIHRPNTEPKGLAVLCVGNFDSKDYDHLVALANELAKAGYVAVRFDPFGLWESAGTINDYSMSGYLKDIGAVIDYMCRDTTYADIVLIGHSVGGMLSLIYAARDERVSKVAAIMPPHIYVRPNVDKERNKQSQWAKTGFKISRRDTPGKTGVMREYNVPYSFVTDSLQYNVLSEVPQIHIPLLLIAGEKDAIIPAEYVKMIYDKANEPKKFVTMTGMDHFYRNGQKFIDQINREILEFLSDKTA